MFSQSRQLTLEQYYYSESASADIIRVSITNRRSIDPDNENHSKEAAESVDSPKKEGTIRTEEYKRDLAEFRARRSSGNKNVFETPENPPKKKSSRHSLPISCTKCSTDVADVSFNYEKTSAQKYHQSKARRSSEERVPNIQFLFSNQQVFMPGNVFTRTSYSEVQHSKRHSRSSARSQDLTLTQHQIDFDEDDNGPESPPLFFKNNCLPFEVSDFLADSPNKDDSISELKNSRKAAPKLDLNNTAESPDEHDSCGDKLAEVMDELRILDEWADEQLRQQSADTSKQDSSKCDVSQYGLPVVSSSAVDITEPETQPWRRGRWGLAPVLVRKLAGVTLEQVRRRQCVQLNILRKFRHPNIMLLMGLYADMDGSVHLICESCVDTLHSILHVQGSILSAQTAVAYASDIASALVFLRMQGYLHTELHSGSVVVTRCGVAKLSDLRACVALPADSPPSSARRYAGAAQYVNMEDGRCASQDCEPLLSAHSSDAAARSSVAKSYADYARSEHYRWQPPELFRPDAAGLVHPCSRTDVYALCLVLWECCNAAVPWQSLSYEGLSEMYARRGAAGEGAAAVRLPRDGSYPGCLLDLLQGGLRLEQRERPDLRALAERLLAVKSTLSGMEDIIITERRSRDKPEPTSDAEPKFSTVAWETNSLSTVDSRPSPRKLVTHHAALVHRTTSEESSSDHAGDNDHSPDEDAYQVHKAFVAESCISESEPDDQLKLVYGRLPEREYSSNCSTPVSRKRVKLNEIGTPGANLHKSDSTEYCTLFSPDNRNLDSTNDIANETSDTPAGVKLCGSFTPQSYKSLQITVPSVSNLQSIKSLSKDTGKKGTYKFDIKNYSLPTTPIARSNKLRKNAWLSGDVPVDVSKVSELRVVEDGVKREPLTAKSAPQITDTDINVNETDIDRSSQERDSVHYEESPKSLNSECDTGSDTKRAAAIEFSFDTEPSTLDRCRSNSWTYKSTTLERPGSSQPRTAEELTNVNVKPLVAIHERWISEANTSKKSDVSFSSIGGYRRSGPSVKPASHSVEPLQSSLPRTSKRHHGSNVTMSPSYSFSGRRGSQSDQFCKVRDRIARSMSFSSRDPDRLEHNFWAKERSKCFSSMKPFSHTNVSVDGDEKENCPDSDINNTSSLDDFVKQLIKKEFYQLLHQTSDDTCNDELIQKGTNNVLDALRSNNTKDPPIDPGQMDAEKHLKSFSRVKINGNNKPLIQITFNKFGENTLQVLDSGVNVTISDSIMNPKVDKSQVDSEHMNMNMKHEQYCSRDDIRTNSLKRCQTFSAIQEARSTEDLYIDDDLSTHMEENFGGNMKMIPLHGSLHEILCEKADECCLIKVKQENGCDKVYLMCENPENNSTDAIDGAQSDSSKTRDKVVFKRSISLIEERYERVYPKEKKITRKSPLGKEKKPLKPRAKAEVLYSVVNRDKCHSAPTLASINEDMKEVKSQRKNSAEVINIETMRSYHDSSSDESLKDMNDVYDFEEMEKKIEEDFATVNTSSNACGILEKISEENLSVHDDDISEKEEYACDLDNKSELQCAELLGMEFRSCEDL